MPGKWITAKPFKYDIETHELFRGNRKLGDVQDHFAHVARKFMQFPEVKLTLEELRSGLKTDVRKAVLHLRTILGDKGIEKTIVTHQGAYEFRPNASKPARLPASDELPFSEIGVLTFNIGGSEVLKGGPKEYGGWVGRIQKDVETLADRLKPLVMCFQEVVVVRDPVQGTEQPLVEAPPGFSLEFIPCFSNRDNRAPRRLEKYRKSGWPDDWIIAQGMAIAVRDGVRRAEVWEFEPCLDQDSIPVETVPVSHGLNPGRRDTETRVYVVAHLLLPIGDNTRDLFVVNVHLPTLTGEREGVPAREIAGSKRRLEDLETVVMNGIVSLMEDYRIEETRKRGSDRGPAIWILAGDLNCTPDSPELELLRACRFLDLNVNKSRGTKRRKGDSDPSITVDYVLAGCLFAALDGFLARDSIVNQPNPEPISDIQSSDHLPVFAKLPVSVIASRR